MKYLLILFLFIYSGTQAQIKFIQTRKAENNHSDDEWVAVIDSANPPSYTIHDTIYLPQKEIDSILLSKIKKPEGIIWDTTLFTSFTVSYGPIRHIYPKTHKQKKKYELVKVPLYPCPMDTIRGLIVYNNGDFQGYDGNTTIFGYWIGYCPNYLHVIGKRIIPAVYKQSDLIFSKSGRLVPSIRERRRGSFRTLDFKRIPYNSVYGLFVDY
jgi:hypothetical protein